jgi:hypothetical protein
MYIRVHVKYLLFLSDFVETCNFSTVFRKILKLTLVIQHAMRMSHIIVTCLTLPYISTLSHKRQGFRKKKTLLKIKVMFWLSVQLLSEIFLILRRIHRDITINVHRCSCKVPVSLVRFCWNLQFLDSFSKNTQISNFTKIRPVGAELFHSDGQACRQTWRS